MSGAVLQFPVRQPGAEEEACATELADPFLDSLDHLQALELEAKLLIAHAAARSCAQEGAEGAAAWQETRQHFPFLPPGADLAAVRRLLDEVARLNRRRESASERAGAALHFQQFCRQCGLDEFERTVVMLLLMQYTAPQFIAICRKSGLAEDARGNGMKIGTLLEVACGDYREQLERRRHFSVEGTLVRGEIVVLGYVDRTTNILDVAATLHERAVRRVLGDGNLYSTALGFIRRERVAVSLEQVVLPEGVKEEVLACVGRYLAERSEGRLASLDAALGYGTGLALLFHGPSGTGKTMLARALAARFGRQVLSLALAEMRNRHWSPDEVLGGIFREAELQGAIVLLDECDDLFQNNSPMSRALLVELEKARCVVIMATNKPVDMDPALERRIAMKVRLRIPDAATRLRMWRALLPDEVDLARDVDLAECAERYRFSGGLIKNAILVAVVQAPRGADGRPRITRALLERAAALQDQGLAGEGSLYRQYVPGVAIESLQLRAGDKRKLAGAARAWESLRAEGIGLCVLISARDVQAGREAAEALARECGLEVRAFDFRRVSVTDSEGGPVDPVTQTRVSPLDYALSEALGTRAMTLFVDRMAEFAGLLKKDDSYLLNSLRWRLAHHQGLFCLVTTALTRFEPPEEFNVHLVLDEPPEEAQVLRWREQLGDARLPEGDLARFVGEWPMHLHEIDWSVRQATILRAVRGGSGRATLAEVREVLERRRGKSRGRVLFGEG